MIFIPDPRERPRHRPASDRNGGRLRLGLTAGFKSESPAGFVGIRTIFYKVWNRMASGSYHPPPVRLVEIPKATGNTRPLGIPTVADRVAQTAVTMVLEPLVEPH